MDKPKIRVEERVIPRVCTTSRTYATAQGAARDTMVNWRHMLQDAWSCMCSRLQISDESEPCSDWWTENFDHVVQGKCFGASWLWVCSDAGAQKVCWTPHIKQLWAASHGHSGSFGPSSYWPYRLCLQPPLTAQVGRCGRSWWVRYLWSIEMFDCSLDGCITNTITQDETMKSGTYHVRRSYWHQRVVMALTWLLLMPLIWSLHGFGCCWEKKGRRCKVSLS